MTSTPVSRSALLERQAGLRHDLAVTTSQLKRHMNWIVISNAYGKNDDDQQPPVFTYDEAVKYALNINRRIDMDRDKAYRSVVCIVGWTWLETGERVYDDDELRLNGFHRMDYYEVPS